MNRLIVDDAGFVQAEMAADLAELLVRQSDLQDADPIAAAEVAAEIEVLLSKMGEQGSRGRLEPTYQFSAATDAAKLLFSIGAQTGPGASAYNTAVAIENACKAAGLTVSWDTEESLPVLDEATMDAASGALFAELGADGYIKGAISRGGNVAAIVTLRGDGDALFMPTEWLVESSGTTSDEMAEEAVNFRNWDAVIEAAIADIVTYSRTPEEREAAYQADREKQAAEELAARKKSEAKKQQRTKDLVKSAESFGAGLPGFVGVVSESLAAVSEALSDKPIGSFVFTIEGAMTFGLEPQVGMYTLQRTKNTRGRRHKITADGMPTRLMVSKAPTAQDAYAQGNSAILSAGGVVLANAGTAEAKPKAEPVADTRTPVQKWGSELAAVLAASGPQATMDRQTAIIASNKLTVGESAALVAEFTKAAGIPAAQKLKDWASPRGQGMKAQGRGEARAAPDDLDAGRKAMWLEGWDRNADTDWLIAVRDGTADVSDMRATVARVKELALSEINGDFAKQVAAALTKRVLAKAKTTIGAQG